MHIQRITVYADLETAPDDRYEKTDIAVFVYKCWCMYVRGRFSNSKQFL